MICIENDLVNGFEAAIRGMRNPMNSWDKSDSGFCTDFQCGADCYPGYETCPAWNEEKCSIATEYLFETGVPFVIGPNDMKLAKSLVKSGSDHAKFRRMITVYCDITAPLYWWKEFDTYKVGTVANSCSTMHKIHEKTFIINDFSHEHIMDDYDDGCPQIDEGIKYGDLFRPDDILQLTVDMLNACRSRYIETKDKRYWWQMIQLLPSSYNQKRTIMLSYEVLANIYNARKDHKLDEWRNFCHWIETLPYADGLIFQREGENDENM